MHVAVQVALIIVGAWVVVASIGAFVGWRIYRQGMKDYDTKAREAKELMRERREERHRNWEQRAGDILEKPRRD